MWSVRMATRISSSTYPLGKEWHRGHSTGLDLDAQSCVGLAKLLNLSLLPFPPLRKGDNNSIYLIELYGLSELIYTKD